MEMITVQLDGKEHQVSKGTTYYELAKEVECADQGPIALVSVNGKISELYKEVKEHAKLEFLTSQSMAGYRAYVRTATFMLIKAVQDVAGIEQPVQVKVDYLVGTGYFCRCLGGDTVDEAFAKKVNDRMEELVAAKIPVKKKRYALADGIEILRSQGMLDKEKVLRFRRTSSVNLYEIDGFYDYFYGPMLSNTSEVPYFKITAYEDGIFMWLPSKEQPNCVNGVMDKEKLFHALRQSDEWGSTLGISNVGELNELISHGGMQELILVQEALMESRIGDIARSIHKQPKVKFVMIAGPSSSGKTTFSHRLSIQLKTLGLKPHPIAVDDYFVNRENTPKDEDGKYNYECIEAIDCAQFNQDMLDLLAGKAVELPSYNFKTGKREYKGNITQLGPDDLLVIEGIHGLNDKMSEKLDNEYKFKIYISALTTLNIDDHNRIPTTDGRLLRRIVRDARTRNMEAKQTIDMWASVRRGEESNIFPYQENVDVMFNSALIYEIAMLKQYAEPLLLQIEVGEPEYEEAQRLLKFLDFFLNASREMIPNNSITREFVGGSCFLT